MIPNAAGDNCKRRRRCLQFPRAKLTIATRRIWQKSMLCLTVLCAVLVLSMLSVRKFVLGNCLPKGETRFKALFCVWGRKVPQKQKQALRRRLPVKSFDKTGMIKDAQQPPKATSSKASVGMISVSHGSASFAMRLNLCQISSMFPVMFIPLTGCVIMPCSMRKPSMP